MRLRDHFALNLLASDFLIPSGTEKVFVLGLGKTEAYLEFGKEIILNFDLA